MDRLNPLNDFAFQKSLGEKGDEEQLIGFLNAVLKRTGNDRIESVEIIENKDIPAEIVGGKMSKLDVLGRLVRGTKLNIDEHSSSELIAEVLKMDGAIRKTQEKMDLIARDPAMLRAYEQYEKAASDYTSGINAARREGQLIGERRGEQRGQLIGEQRGEQNKAMTIARKMKNRGKAVEEIADDTGLSLEEIARL
jgi:hypothetical protein